VASARELIEGTHTTEGGGRMTSYRLYFDRVDFMTQLGLMPEPAAAGA